MDGEFFQLITASAEATAQSGNQAGAQQLLTLQNKLVKLSSYGAKLERQQQVVKTAAAELQALGSQLTRDKLLELILKSTRRGCGVRPRWPARGSTTPS